MKTAFSSFWVFVATGFSLSAALDPTSHVFVIVMENHVWSDIKGSPDAPYINNTLLPMASYCDQYYNPPGLHPSEPNYLWLEAGTNFNVTNDNLPAQNLQISPAHFVTQLKNAGISWKTYQEDIDGTSCPMTDSVSGSGLFYVAHHNPFVYFDDVANSNAPPCVAVVRPFSELTTDLGSDNVARYNFITPSTCHDMHDSCAPTSNPVRQGDDWLAANLPVILNSAAYQNNGLIIITWDEGESGMDGPLGCIVLSPLAKAAGYHSGIRYTHSATLRTLQKIFGVGPFLGGAATGTDLADLFQAGAIPNVDQPPTVVTTSASNVSGGNATLGGSITPNGDSTTNWFEYGLTAGYGADTISRSSDNAESYSAWAYGSNGGTGFGAITYREGNGGGIYLEAGGAKSTAQNRLECLPGAEREIPEAADRKILDAQQAGTLNISVRWNVDNSVAFSGFNLKSATGTHFGDSELISVGIRPGNGNNTIAVNGGAQTIILAPTSAARPWTWCLPTTGWPGPTS